MSSESFKLDFEKIQEIIARSKKTYAGNVTLNIIGGYIYTILNLFEDSCIDICKFKFIVFEETFISEKDVGPSDMGYKYPYPHSENTGYEILRILENNHLLISYKIKDDESFIRLDHFTWKDEDIATLSVMLDTLLTFIQEMIERPCLDHVDVGELNDKYICLKNIFTKEGEKYVV